MDCSPSVSSISALRECLLDLSQPIAKRTHAAFYLRSMSHDEDRAGEAVAAILAALQVRDDSSLMRHELAYILGQMQNAKACDVLIRILRDESEDTLVRHECAEALGAIGDVRALDTISEYCDYHLTEISETCQIARDLIAWKSTAPLSDSNSARGLYQSVDPAPPFQPGSQSLEVLSSMLLDRQESLFKRYRAMFSLRDMNTDAAALALVEGFKDSSALFRHEIAYVLGQMQRPCTVRGLEMVLSDKLEHRMVRHEAAESLGSIGGDVAENILRSYMSDEENVVHQSCEVALDTIDYWSNEFSKVTSSDVPVDEDVSLKSSTTRVKYA